MQAICKKKNIYICYIMQKFLEILKEKGSKVTRPRKKVLSVLLNANYPFTLSEIYRNCTDIDFASVYRTVQLFISMKIVRQINMCDKKIRYELIIDKPHHHIQCDGCGKIEKLDICILDEVRKLTDYNITEHMMDFSGLCPDCKIK